MEKLAYCHRECGRRSADLNDANVVLIRIPHFPSATLG
jgi:hypothetical protein